jgi:hypothetical protein
MFKKKISENDKLLKNIERYEEEKAKQQESKILGQKQVKKTRGKEKGTRMYHL